jgi:hypothetical protein
MAKDDDQIKRPRLNTETVRGGESRYKSGGAQTEGKKKKRDWLVVIRRRGGRRKEGQKKCV